MEAEEEEEEEKHSGSMALLTTTLFFLPRGVEEKPFVKLLVNKGSELVDRVTVSTCLNLCPL